MKVTFKVFKLFFKPSIVKQAFENLLEIIEYNLDTEEWTELESIMNEYIKFYGVIELVKACFMWLINEVIPRWIKELLDGHALTLNEIDWNETHEE